MKTKEKAILTLSGKIFDYPLNFSLNELDALRAALDQELLERGLIVIRRIATLSKARFSTAPYFLSAGFETIPADDEDVQATATIFSELASPTPPDAVVFALGFSEPIEFLRTLIGRTRRVLLTNGDVSQATVANLEEIIDVRKLSFFRESATETPNKEEPNKETSNKEGTNNETSNKEGTNNETSNKEGTNNETSNEERINNETSNEEKEEEEKEKPKNEKPVESENAADVEKDFALAVREAPKWNAALEQILLDNNFQYPADRALELISDRFPYLPALFIEDKKRFESALSKKTELVDENGTSPFFQKKRFVSTREAEMSLNIGGATALEEPPKILTEATTFEEIAIRAELLRKHCTWSADRVFLLQSGVNPYESIYPRDAEFRNLANEASVYLWAIAYQKKLSRENFWELADCYDVATQAFSLLTRVLDSKTACDFRFLIRVAQCAANAQCAIKSALLRFGLSINVDRLQRDSFNLLKKLRFDRGFKLDNMRRDSVLEASEIPFILEECNVLAAEFSDRVSRTKERRECEKRVEFHLKKVRSNPISIEDWNKAIDAATTLCETFREPVSSLWFRQQFLDFVDKLPDEAQTTETFGRIVQEIDLYRLNEEEKYLVAAETPETEYSPEVRLIRERYAGAKAVFVGGTPQDHLRERLENQLNVRLIWSESDHGESLTRFESLIRDEETRLFLIYIPWCSHKHSEELAALLKSENKDFARLPKGTNPKQIALAVCRQLNLIPN